jgi:hypothetical protein
LSVALPAVVGGLAVVIVAVTVAGIIRILTIPADGEVEIKMWVSVVALLVGLTMAAVVVTCAAVLRQGGRREAMASQADRWPPPPPPAAGEVPAIDYVANDGASL